MHTPDAEIPVMLAAIVVPHISVPHVTPHISVPHITPRVAPHIAPETHISPLPHIIPLIVPHSSGSSTAVAATSPGVERQDAADGWLIVVLIIVAFLAVIGLTMRGT